MAEYLEALDNELGQVLAEFATFLYLCYIISEYVGFRILRK